MDAVEMDAVEGNAWFIVGMLEFLQQAQVSVGSQP
jgi:hypothetical protein